MTSIESSTAAAQGVAVQARQLKRIHGERAVLQDISLQIAPGEVLALLGPSGCGKTTLLKILAGLEQPSRGEVWMGGQCAASASQSLPPERRELGLVLQDHALWPHMSLQANVAFALEMRGLPRAQIHERVQQTLGLVGLQGMGERLPGSLSGGQRKLLEMARALMSEPTMIMLDEPMAGVNPALTQSLLGHIAQLRDDGMTVLFVEHDMHM
uniref:ABC transporter ATP-binding protein n=1 Tax=Delftia acidovorans TaxID=80866 RepID=UPI0035A0A502